MNTKVDIIPHNAPTNSELVEELRAVTAATRREYGPEAVAEVVAVALIEDKLATSQAAARLLRTLPHASLTEIAEADAVVRKWARLERDPARVIDALCEVTV